MKPKWKFTILIATLSFVLLSACTANKRDSLNQEKDVNFQPINYEPRINRNESNNDYKNQDNRRFLHDESPPLTDNEAPIK